MLGSTAVRSSGWIAAVVLLLSLVATPSAASAAPAATPDGRTFDPWLTSTGAGAGNLGTNLAAVTYYDGVVPFANLVDHAGDWIPQRNGGAWASGDPLTLRRDGWPSSLATDQYATAVLAEVRYPAGDYAVSWTGSGSFDINGTRFSGRNGRGTVTLDGTSLALLNLRVTDPADPVRAVRVTVPGESPTATFRSAYLATLRPYRALRFMDWQRTNAAAWEPRRTFTCANRTLPHSYSQGTSSGASVERMVELANTLDADPWFTIPHEADNSWVTCVAQVVATTLEPGLTPRFEFSNETWNPTFRAFHDLTAEARATGLGAGDSFLGLQLRHGQRHAAAMNAVASGFARSPGRTFVRVLAGQAANAWVLEQRAATPQVRAATDEIAIAPYLGVPGVNPFDPAVARTLAQLTVPQLFGRLTVAQSEEVDRWTSAHTTLAASLGKRLVAYEAGQHLAGDSGNDGLTSLFTEANRTPAMGAAYRTYLQRWRAATGNALLMHFTDVGPATKWGSWGALEYPEQVTSPKYAELVRFAAGDVVPPARPPEAPTTVTAVAGDRSASLRFRLPPSDGGSRITNYEYRHSANGGLSWTAWTPLTPPDVSSPVRVGGLRNGLRYRIQLRAVNSAGAGAASAYATVTPRR